GEAQICVAGGVESMSRSPFVVGKAEQAFSKDFKVFDSSLGARFPNPKIESLYGADTMAQTSDNLARDYQITREDCDVFALGSQQKYATAAKDGFFQSEIRPVTIPQGRGRPDVTVSEDEHPRPESNIDSLARLKAIYPEGVTTAGNASGINDGAAALVIASREAGEKAGVQPIARIVASGVAGVPPRIMGFGPVPASNKALERAGLTLKDMDVIEINEAFAAQVLACLKGFGLAADDDRVNPNGGAIAVGHPLGASGARLALTAARQLHRSGGRYALATMCIGVGQGIAVVLERM
ncbi:MAG TPA: acetyl-CoA C-acyltransferase, partial [Hyphomicrobiaceae bacterium]|nr:acetyl-CoA C-acyltransferase [Hyphomicrobiaceae bacterium]